MIEPQRILGFVVFFGGLFMIALNEAAAREYEEQQKALGRRSRPKHAYIAGRILSILGGSLLVLFGALMMYGFQFSN